MTATNVLEDIRASIAYALRNTGIEPVRYAAHDVSDEARDESGKWTDGGNATSSDAAEEYKRLGTRAPRFKAWFGDWENDAPNASKVVDPETGEPQSQHSLVERDGHPIAVHHGTKQGGFNAFDPGKIKDPARLLYGPGFYFTEDPEIAEEYAGKSQSIVGVFDSQQDAEQALKEEQATGDYASWWNRTHSRTTISIEQADGASGQAGKWRMIATYYPLAGLRLDRELTDADYPALEKEAKDFEKAVDRKDPYIGVDQQGAIDLFTAGKLTDSAKNFMANPTFGYDGTPQATWFARFGANLRAAIGVKEVAAVGSEIKNVYLNIRRPFDIDKPHAVEPLQKALDKYIDEHVPSGPPSVEKESRDAIRDGMRIAETISGEPTPDGRPDGKLLYHAIAGAVGKDGANEILRAAGYDGITHIGGQILGHKDHRVWIAFEPTQIKSTANNGEFSSMDERIDHANPGEPLRYKAEQDAGRHWVTLHGGTRVLIDEDGTVQHGPKELRGKSLKKHDEQADSPVVDAATATKPKRKTKAETHAENTASVKQAIKRGIGVAVKNAPINNPSAVTEKPAKAPRKNAKPVKVHKTAEQQAAARAEITARRAENKQADAAEFTETINRAAEMYDLDPDQLRETAEYVWQEMYNDDQEREKAKEKVRKDTGLSQQDYQLVVDFRGGDHSSAHFIGGEVGDRMKALDVKARSIALSYPQFNIGQPVIGDDVDWAEKIWGIIGEGKMPLPRKSDRQVIQEAVAILKPSAAPQLEDQQGEADDTPDEWTPQYEPEPEQGVPFSKEGFLARTWHRLTAAVNRYARQGTLWGETEPRDADGKWTTGGATPAPKKTPTQKTLGLKSATSKSETATSKSPAEQAYQAAWDWVDKGIEKYGGSLQLMSSPEYENKYTELQEAYTQAKKAGVSPLMGFRLPVTTFDGYPTGGTRADVGRPEGPQGEKPKPKPAAEPPKSDTPTPSPPEPGESEFVGEARAQYAKLGTKAPLFKKWFGDWENDPEHASKVVDHTGAPQKTSGSGVLRVYHGTTEGFDEFRPPRYGTHVGKGFYFAESKEIAENFAQYDFDTGRPNKNSRIVEAYLDIKNPWDMDTTTTGDELKKMAEAGAEIYNAKVARKAKADDRITAQDILDEVKHDRGDDGSISRYKAWSAIQTYIGIDRVNDVLEKLGYDGITHRSGDQMGTMIQVRKNNGDHGRVWIAFRPPQIKSVDNRGTFNPLDGHIKHAASGETVHYEPGDFTRTLVDKVRDYANAIHYARQMTIWDKKLHPREDDGKFAEKGTGSILEPKPPEPKDAPDAEPGKPFTLTRGQWHAMQKAANPNYDIQDANRKYKAAIKALVEAGKPVDPGILEDYPDLQELAKSATSKAPEPPAPEPEPEPEPPAEDPGDIIPKPGTPEHKAEMERQELRLRDALRDMYESSIKTGKRFGKDIPAESLTRLEEGLRKLNEQYPNDPRSKDVTIRYSDYPQKPTPAPEPKPEPKPPAVPGKGSTPLAASSGAVISEDQSPEAKAMRSKLELRFAKACLVAQNRGGSFEGTIYPPITKQQAVAYTAAASRVFAAMNLNALQRFADNVNEIELYRSTTGVAKSYRRYKRGGKGVGGYYVWSLARPGGNLNLDGDMHYPGSKKVWLDTVGLYAHEFGHAIDGHYDYTGTRTWRDLYRKEIEGNKLSGRADYDHTEGWAEFARLILTEGPELAKQKFPGCYDYWKSRGL